MPTELALRRIRQAICTLLMIVLVCPMVLSAGSVGAEGNCGPRGGTGRPGCGPPSPNAAPVVIGASRSAAQQRTAITIVIDRGESLDGLMHAASGQPGGVNIFIS